MEEILSLSWNAHQNNICKGLSLLQQRGEYVDMTLAADGHHVKVHQMVLSLASPYIKELISTAQCPHPVIFLNNIKYATLCAILEYVYTGETLIPKDILADLIAAGKALHIKGLEEMGLFHQKDCNKTSSTDIEDPLTSNAKINLHNIVDDSNAEKQKSNIEELESTCKVFVNCDDDDNDCTEADMEIASTTEAQDSTDQIEPTGINETRIRKNRMYRTTTPIQYTISNQGNLQVVVNRFIYNLKYVQKNLNKYWRCVDYAYRKCPANVYTNTNNHVVKRRGTHNHPFHDQKIMKKSRMRLIFQAYEEAEEARTNTPSNDVE